MSRLSRHDVQRSKKVGRFFAFAFVGVGGTPECKNGKIKKAQGILDDCLVLFIVCSIYKGLLLRFYFLRSNSFFDSLKPPLVERRFLAILV